MKRNSILALLGFTLFFMVISVFYAIIIVTEGKDDILAPFFPVIVLSGFFIFLIGAFLVALSILRMIEKKLL